MEITLHLPFPPSVNHYWTRTRWGGMAIGKAGRGFRTSVVGVWLRAGAPRFGSARVAVTVEAYPTGQRRCDVDNLCKAILDSLTAHDDGSTAGLWEDDEQVDELHVFRRGPLPPGKVIVMVRKL